MCVWMVRPCCKPNFHSQTFWSTKRCHCKAPGEGLWQPHPLRANASRLNHIRPWESLVTLSQRLHCWDPCHSWGQAVGDEVPASPHQNQEWLAFRSKACCHSSIRAAHLSTMDGRLIGRKTRWQICLKTGWQDSLLNKKVPPCLPKDVVVEIFLLMLKSQAKTFLPADTAVCQSFETWCRMWNPIINDDWFM